MFPIFWREDLFAPMSVAMLFAAGWLLLGRTADGARGRWFYLALSAGMFGAALSSRMHAGGYVNVNIPAFAVLSILSGLAVAGLLDRSRRRAPPGAAVGSAIATASFCSSSARPTSRRRVSCRPPPTAQPAIASSS
jgi:hypothetical protein